MRQPNEDTNDLLLTSPLATELEDAADAGTDGSDLANVFSGRVTIVEIGELQPIIAETGERRRVEIHRSVLVSTGRQP